MNKKIKNVAIVGGTHGNEVTGVYLLRRWQENPDEIIRPSFITNLFFANPKAFSLNRRFVDKDLNRCFDKQTLERINSESYEVNRGILLNNLIGPKGQAKHDFIIDLHTSTTNCGAMIILLDDNVYNWRLAAYLSLKIPESKIHYIPPKNGEQPYLSSISPLSLTVEVGPIPQGLLRYDIFSLANLMVIETLNYVEMVNSNVDFNLPETISVFKFIEAVHFPRDENNIDAMIHESLQDRDYQPLTPGAPLFRMLNGEEIYYQGTKTVYPVFINEAAYYYNSIAMSLTTKEEIQIRSSNF